MKRRVTIEDIAAEVGVSRQTVTRAMNGMPRIRKETREKVLEASKRLGYQPSRFAKNLASSDKTKAIGFVVETFRNPFYTEFTAELLSLIAAQGWQMNVSSHEVAPPSELTRRLAREVDVIVGYLPGDRDELLATTHGIPIILIGEDTTHPEINSVGIDFDSGIAELIAGLRERGSRRFGFLESRQPTSHLQSPRRIAYERHVDQASREAVVVVEPDFREVDGGIDGFRRLREQFPETDTVIAFSDMVAMGALVAAHEDGLSVPDDIRIVGIDGLSLGAVTYPAMTSLAILGSELATATAGLLERVLSGDGVTGEHLRVTPRPMWRDSA